MRARDLLLLLTFLALGGFGAWSWWSQRAPESARKLPSTTSVAAIPDEPDAPGQRRALGKPVETKQEPSKATGVPIEYARKNSAAIEALERSDFARAIELFEACHTALPDVKIFAENLAEAYARSGNQQFDAASDEERAKALVSMRRAHELAPAREDIKLRLEQIERLSKSEEGFWKDSSEHFDLSYDGERHDLLMGSLQVVTPILERAYQQYGELFDVWPVEKGRPKIRVVLYRREGFHDATGIGHWAGGLFDGTVRVPVEDLQQEKRDLERVLRHEIAHAFISSAGGANVPGWLNEGLAQWLEHEDLNARAARIKAARARLEGKDFLPLEQLQKSLAELSDAATIQLAYSEGLALVDHLERNFGERVLFEMVAGCKKSVAVSTSFQKRTGQELASALGELAQDLSR